MLRVKASELSYLDNTALYNGSPFTGAAYFISDGVVANVSRFSRGEVVGRYVRDFLPDVVPPLSIDADLLESEDDLEPYLYQGKPFTGLTCDFDGNKCVGEALYEHGHLCHELSWHNTGEIATLEIINDDLYQNIWWYRNGNHQHIKISDKDSFKLEAEFNKEELITSIRIEGDYFTHTALLRDKIKVHFLEKESDIEKLKLSSYLYLAGTGINSSFLNALEKAKGYENLKRLHINNPELLETDIKQLVNHNNLHELIIDDDTYKSSEIAHQIKRKYPTCHVEYNRSVIT